MLLHNVGSSAFPLHRFLAALPVLAVVFLVSLAIAPLPTAVAQPRSPSLFSGAVTGQRAGEATDLEGSPLDLIRSRPLSLDHTGLAELLRLPKETSTNNAASAPSVLLNLFPDTALPFQVDEVQSTDDGIGVHWKGRVGDPSGNGRSTGYSILTWYQGAIAGFVRLENGEYYRLSIPPFGPGEVRQLFFKGYSAAGVDYVVPSDVTDGGTELPPLARADERAARNARDVPGWLLGSQRQASSPVTIDVLIAFTQNAGSSNEAIMNSFANNLVGEANAIFNSSGVAATLRLVRTVAVSWDDTFTYSGGHYETALAALKSTSDGQLDELHALRDTYGADLVSLIIKPPISGGRSVVGIAYLMQSNPVSFANSAFSVVHNDFAGGPSYSYAHEVGHNLGLVHDDDNRGTSVGYHSYAKGYQQKVFAPKFFTVMAYSLGCDGCTGIPNFSNPTVNYTVIPTGVPDEIDAAKTLEVTKAYAANWRPTAAPPACTYQVSPLYLDTPDTATSFTLTVRTQAGCAWTAESNVSWLTVLQGSSGIGDGSVQAKVEANTTVDVREGTLLVGGQTVTISQRTKPCLLDFSPRSVSLGSGATIAEVAVTTQFPCRYRASTLHPWLSFPDGEMYLGSSVVKVAVGANDTGVPREGHTLIGSTGFNILQNALPSACKYEFQTNGINVGPGASQHTIAFTADPGCPWTASGALNGFVDFQGLVQGKGSGSVAIRIDANPSTLPRSTNVKLGGEVFTITQAGKPTLCSYSVNPLSFDVVASGANVSFTISAAEGCTWLVTSNANWLSTVTDNWGDGTKLVTFRAAPNTSPFARTALIRGGSIHVTVVQAGVPPPANCQYDVSPLQLVFSPYASKQVSKVTTHVACPWSAISSQPWLSISAANGIGTANLELAAEANNSILPRHATVSVGGLSIAVEQAGASAAEVLQASPGVVVLNSMMGSSVPLSTSLQVAVGSAVLPVKLAPPSVPWLVETKAATSTLSPFEVTANAIGLDAGVHQSSLSVSSTGGVVAPVSIPVLFQVRSANMARVSPQSLSFRVGRGPTRQTQILRVTKVQAEPLIHVLTAGGDWLAATVVKQDRDWDVAVEVNPAGLPSGVFDGAIVIGCDSGCASAVVPVRLSVETTFGLPGGATRPRISSGGIVNAASFRQGISSGAWMSVFGADLSTSSRLWQDSDFEGNRFPLSLDGVHVTVAGTRAPMNYISPGQLNFQAPSDLPAGWVLVEVETPEGKDAAFVYAAPEVPGLFTIYAENQVAALHPDGVPARQITDNDASGRPAKAGDILAIFGTGFGPTDPDIPSGEIYSGAAPLVAAAHVQVFIGGVAAEVQFVGLSAAGLHQLNVVVPALPAGMHNVVMVIGGIPTQPGMLLYIAE